MSSHKDQFELDFERESFIDDLGEEWTVEKTPLVVYAADYDIMTARVEQTAVNTLNDLQGNLKKWQEDNFDADGTGPEWMALGACEELGELAHVLVKSKQKIRQHQAGLDKASLDEVADSVADVTIYLMQLCSHLGINFGTVLFNTARQVMKRNWKKHPKNGVTE